MYGKEDEQAMEFRIDPPDVCWCIQGSVLICCSHEALGCPSVPRGNFTASQPCSALRCMAACSVIDSESLCDLQASAVKDKLSCIRRGLSYGASVTSVAICATTVYPMIASFSSPSLSDFPFPDTVAL